MKEGAVSCALSPQNRPGIQQTLKICMLQDISCGNDGYCERERERERSYFHSYQISIEVSMEKLTPWVTDPLDHCAITYWLYHHG